MKVTLIHNSKAGDDDQPSSEVLLSLLRQAGYEVTYQSPKAQNWADALESPGEFVVVAGGDGTLGKVAKQLVGRQIPIAILPLGTANNIAKTLGLMDSSLEELVAGWTTAKPTQFDGAIAQGEWGSTYVVESLGLGLFTQTMAQADNSSALDQADSAQAELAAVLNLLKQQVSRCSAQSLQVSLDGQDLSGSYLLLEAMNIQYVGPNLHLAAASVDDGLLTVVGVKESEQPQLYEYLDRCLAGEDCPAPFTPYRGKHLRIQGEGFDIHIDDQFLPYHRLMAPSEVTKPNPTVIEVKIDPQALQFLLPAPHSS
ncbi:diacylglycerol/lipid kinase family protein [Nodosilinea sp. E11]|uniref:diacylglycerol/lipid kinase family protein n=1 Tax=Nodosilinea sp. E11 TaxID=3037479 RepID=UPI0029349532|nr:diacylglycerol kinase family protein [Nodosilinea sp. E11]WOD41146.1 diacylglycerol kinase family protein [Nodosilinea sp. E11]